MNLLKMSDIAERELYWPWWPYIPGGKVSNIYGDKNVGKTHLAMAVIAGVTGGRALPGRESPNEPIHVLLQTPGDWLNVAKSRLKKCGANCDLIHIAPLELGCQDSDIKNIERIINEIGVIKLFVVDPVDLYLHNADEGECYSYVRRLSCLAALTNCAVVLVGDALPSSVQEIVHSLIIVGPEEGEDKYLRGLSHMTPILGKNMDDYSEDVLFRIHPEEGFQWVGLKSSV
ncbi:MAG: AAA family ATPase, partial [Synergistaceae bacterium]|nr:AAA family ATPase [Synergistaceae bacterium]